MSDALDAAEGSVRKLGDSSKATIEAVVDSVTDAARSTADKAQHLVDSGQDELNSALRRTDEISHRVQSNVAEDPLRAVAIAAVVSAICGFLLGLAVRR